MARPRLRPVPSTGWACLAGDDGTVWRRSGANRGAHPIRPQLKERDGYLYVQTNVRGVQVKRPVHRMVAEAWLPDWHWLLEVHHVNGDRLDNRPCNLRCVTLAEHQRIHGRDVYDADVADCRMEFERRRAEPMPDPYAGKARRRDKAGHVRSLMAQAGKLRKELEKRERRASR